VAPLRKVTPQNVARLARRREPESLAFCEFLKGQAASEEIDRVVQELYRQASAEFDCTQCANCCREISPLLKSDDIARLSRGLGMDDGECIAAYFVRSSEHDGWIFKRMPCPLLQDNRCACYGGRPADCASYPHLHKSHFLRRAQNTVANCSICPIAFTVCERLKARYGW